MTGDHDDDDDGCDVGGGISIKLFCINQQYHYKDFFLVCARK